MFPGDFTKRLCQQKYIDSEALQKALKEPSPVTIRLNRAKWKHVPAESQPVPWCNGAYYLKKRPSFTLDPLFHGGVYYPQEASSLFLEEIFKQTTVKLDNLKVLDLCGAPGGKSTHLSSLIGRNGFLVANEVIRSRAIILAENLTKWGHSNIIVTQNDPSAFARIPGFFDMILVDAPCSGEGMFRDPVAVNEWSVENTNLCSERQKRILRDVWPALKEEGILVYSTCTFNPDENEENIKWLLQNKNAETIRISFSDYKGITEIDHEGIYGYGFYPDRIRGEGLFISVLRKTEKNNKEKPRLKTEKRLILSKEEKEKAKEWSDFHEDSLIKINDNIISTPVSNNDYLIISENLRIIKHGTKIYSVKSKDYIPSHELAMSVNSKINVFYTLNLSLEQALSFLRRENITTSDTPKGWILVRYGGINLGFIKNVGTRINNYYPVEWRIRMRTPEKIAENLIKWEGLSKLNLIFLKNGS